MNVIHKLWSSETQPEPPNYTSTDSGFLCSVFFFFLHCRPVCAFIPCVGYQQHMCVSVMEPDGEQLSASVHGGAVVPTEAAGLWPKC